MKRRATTRVLHAILGLAVIHQLAISNFMQAPVHGKQENFAFELHETVGLITFGIVVLFWGWVLVRKADTALSNLFPWFSARGRLAVLVDAKAALKSLSRMKVPDVQAISALASAVHGLGLALVLCTAATGSAWLMLEGGNAHLVEMILEFHESFAALTWAYLIAHAGTALLHEISGEAVLRKMFPFGRK